jgi:hypothetical protein
MKKYNRFTPRASLAWIGKLSRKMGIWEVIRKSVHLRQKKAGHDPIDKLKDAWINLLCGGKGVVEINTRLRSDAALQRAFGRQSCAEQSTVSRTLSACTAEQVQQLRQAVESVFRQHSRSYPHNYAQATQWLDVDMTGLLAGKQGEGVSKGFFSNAYNKRGRQVGRVLATRYNETVVDRLYPGKVQLERSFQELILDAERVLDLDEARRRHSVVRMDGGGGTDADINWVLNRGYGVITKVKTWRRTDLLLGRVRVWYPDPKDDQRQLGWVEPAFAYAQPTRQIGVEETRANVTHYHYVVVTNLSDERLFAENGLPFQPQAPAPQLLSLAQTLYDHRSGGIETANRNSKSGLGLNKRNKRSFAAQEMLVLLAQLAYNLLSWVQHCLAQSSSVFSHYGWQRMVRDLFQIPGQVSFDGEDRLIAIRLTRDHPLASPFIAAVLALGKANDLSLILRKN